MTTPAYPCTLDSCRLLAQGLSLAPTLCSSLAQFSTSQLSYLSAEPDVESTVVEFIFLCEVLDVVGIGRGHSVMWVIIVSKICLFAEAKT